MGHLPQDVLSAFADDELSLAEAEAARLHLAGCASCRAELADYARFDAALSAPPALSCDTVRPLLSAQLDGEADAHEALAAAAHLATCQACRGLRHHWLATDGALRRLPTGLPSRRVDAAIAALGRRERARRPAFDWRRVAAAPVLAAGATVAGASLLIGVLSGGPAAKIAVQPLPIANPAGAVTVALAVQEVLNTKTNTLYALRPAQNSVAALDPFSKLTRAVISVPAKPITLAVNEDANKVYVLDVQRSLIEIDGETNTVVSTTPNVVQGQPTAIQYDATKKQIVVAAQAPAPTAAPTAAPSAGVVTVLDSATKTVLRSTTTDAVARAVVLDETGARALLVSKDAATVVDAKTYELSLRLPGGLAGAFGAKGGPIGIIAAASGGTRLVFFGDGAPAPVGIDGAPVAITALPGGGFGVLVDVNGQGRVQVVDASGKLAERIDVGALGPTLIYDAATRRFAVVGADVTFAAAPGASQPTVAASPQPSAPASPQPAATATPSASGTPDATATAAPTASPAPTVAAASPSASPLPVPAGATLVWTGTYRVELPYGKRASVAAIDPRKQRIWFVDQNRTLNAMRTSDYAIFPVAQLPRGANIDALLVGHSRVYAIDTAGVQLYELALPSEVLSAQSIGLLRDGVGFTLTADDRLWFGRANQLIGYDPRARRLAAVDTRLTAIASVASDPGGRVWFAGAGDRLGMYDTRTARLTEYGPLPRKGSVTAMSVDGMGRLWLATDAGELFSVADGLLQVSARVDTRVSSFGIDGSGVAWSVGPASVGTVYRPVDGSRTSAIVPGAVRTMFFDADGRAWLLDRMSGVFYATVAVP